MANGNVTTRIISVELSLGGLISNKLDENSSIEFTRKNLEESWFDTFGSFTPIDSA